MKKNEVYRTTNHFDFKAARSRHQSTGYLSGQWNQPGHILQMEGKIWRAGRKAAPQAERT